MKLLNSFVSPFAARAQVAIYAYDLPVEIAPSGQWLENFEKSPDYLKINPIGRVPALLLDDGKALPESSVVVEYLADAFPGTGLRPTDVQTAARARLLAHLGEIVEKRARVSAYWNRIQAEPAVERVIGEMKTAIADSPMPNLLPHLAEGS